jgi:hypothetical protein
MKPDTCQPHVLRAKFASAQELDSGILQQTQCNPDPLSSKIALGPGILDSTLRGR